MKKTYELIIDGDLIEFDKELSITNYEIHSTQLDKWFPINPHPISSIKLENLHLKMRDHMLMVDEAEEETRWEASAKEFFSFLNPFIHNQNLGGRK